jgi:hypothetical protein
VRLFDQNAITLAYDPIGDIAGETLSRWGESLAMSEFGSLIASGAIRSKTDAGHSVGSVRVYLDETPFCSKPAGDKATLEDLFLGRNICRDALNLPSECAAANCKWVEHLVLPPSASPSVALSAPATITPIPSALMVAVLPNKDAPTASPTNAPSQVVVLHDDKTLDSHDGEDNRKVQWAAISVSVFVVLVAGGALVKKFSTRSTSDAELEAQEAAWRV